jgi:hypothetical protein
VKHGSIRKSTQGPERRDAWIGVSASAMQIAAWL